MGKKHKNKYVITEGQALKFAQAVCDVRRKKEQSLEKIRTNK